MEHFWLAVGIGTALSAIWVIYVDGFEAGREWLWFPGIAFAMYFFRRLMRGRLEALDDHAKDRG